MSIRINFSPLAGGTCFGFSCTLLNSTRLSHTSTVNTLFGISSSKLYSHLAPLLHAISNSFFPSMLSTFLSRPLLHTSRLLRTQAAAATSQCHLRHARAPVCPGVLCYVLIWISYRAAALAAALTARGAHTNCQVGQGAETAAHQGMNTTRSSVPSLLAHARSPAWTHNV